MPKRTILFPLKQGSRTPEESREAVRTVIAERDVATWTAAQPSTKILPMKSKKRVLLEPATISPKRALIEAAVERVAAERERRVAAERAAAKAKDSRRSEPPPQG